MKQRQGWRAISLISRQLTLRSRDLRRTVVTTTNSPSYSLAAVIAAIDSPRLALNTRVGSPNLPTSANILVIQRWFWFFLHRAVTLGMLAAVNKGTC